MTSYTETGELKVQIVTLDNPVYDEESNLLTYRQPCCTERLKTNSY